ncbi:hypothetical protein ASPWEDRAFT_109092 [Aspergillus wentii DTO 134E9]|uniref:MARVEL domain-containing protein n=1 Tax=Aspergillus wentii DTO 134E9 TaxID=1073089 RepID=A0A1L9RPX7_ASPWE|nr:uncharacterized protein ASPWEDRAFT_109092 [Aspergillus wentii DTO 134E9]KAI9923913.1 hypothetical protein MW887_008218 [Aspergillus wentii]OJJ36952.1 hypothetical protein ASPWEDRAFT_109092 [Aspergillus wentii DTO 134E9]
MQLVTSILRAFQLLFAIIVLGLSVNLAKGQVRGSAPAETGYAAFTGGFGIVAAFVGIVALFVDSLSGIISGALDAVASIAFLAGGIAYAVVLKGTSCDKLRSIWDNKILSQGCYEEDDFKICNAGVDKVKSRCHSAKADTAFMFLNFFVCVAVCGWVLFKRRGSTGASYA